MKHKLHVKARQIAQSSATKKALIAMKPEKSVWGFLGIILFLVLPEVIAFIYGFEITAYAKEGLRHSPSFIEKHYFDFLVMMFEEAGSGFNLAIACALLVWFFF